MFTPITDHLWTTQLWYGAYTHVVDICCDSNMPMDPVDWARCYCKGRHRTYSTYVRSSARPRKRSSVRLYTRGSDYKLILETWGDRITMVRTPMNDTVEAELLSGITVNIRDTLYWNRYRYAVHFYCKAGPRSGLRKWVENSLGKDKRAVRLGRGNYHPILYLRDDSDLVMVRMSEPDMITSISKIYTHNELAQAVR